MAACHNQSASTYRRCEDSRGGNRDERSCDLSKGVWVREASVDMFISGTMRRLTIFDPVLQHQLRALLACLPPWRDRAPGWFPAKVCQLLIGLIQYRVLLLQVHAGWIFMRVAMQTATIPSGIRSREYFADLVRIIHFMSRIPYHLTLFWKSFERVSWYEPCRLYLVLLE